MLCFVDIEGAGKQEDMMQLALQKNVIVVCENCFCHYSDQSEDWDKRHKVTLCPAQPARKVNKADSTLVPVLSWSEGKGKWRSHWQANKQSVETKQAHWSWLREHEVRGLHRTAVPLAEDLTWSSWEMRRSKTPLIFWNSALWLTASGLSNSELTKISKY